MNIMIGVMQDKNVFNAEKIAIIECKMIKGAVDTPEYFDISGIVGHKLDNSLKLSFNLQEKLIRADCFYNIQTESKGHNDEEASGSFHLVFIFQIENLEALIYPNANNRVTLSPILSNTISSISYSTSRGVLLMRLQGTALQNFILPVINTDKLTSDL